MAEFDHVYTIYNASTVDIVVENHVPPYLADQSIPHPLHLHGHDFWVLGVTDMSTNGNADRLMEWTTDLTVRAARCGHALDSSGNCNYNSLYDASKLNLVDPFLKDTVNVPGGGWVYLRFIADNPGTWFFHCHIGSHMEEGMRVSFNIMPYSQPDFPDGYPFYCGLCRPDSCDYCDETTTTTTCDDCTTTETTTCSSSGSATVTNTVNVNFANMFNGLTLS